MKSALIFAIVAFVALPFLALARMGLRNYFEFEKLCEMVATKEGRLHELRSTQDASDGLNPYQVELHKRLMQDEFESCDTDEIAQLATRLATSKRRFYVLFIAYLLAVGLPVLYLSR